MKKFFLFLLVSLIILPFSLGQLVVSPENFTIEKTPSEEKKFVFNVTNTGNFSYEDINFQSGLGDKITMSTISKLEPEQTATINSTVLSSGDFEEKIRIKGFYNASLGQTPESETYEIDMKLELEDNYDIDKCDFSINIGDTVIWNNVHDISAISIYDINNVKLFDIQPNASYPMTFNDAQSFEYYAKQGSATLIPSLCAITVLSDDGLVNNPDLDAVVDLNIKMVYPETQIKIEFLPESVEMDFFESNTDLFKITNIGNNEVVDATIQGDWFSFTENNINIPKNSHKVIGYTLEPQGITKTNQTNKTYTKTVTLNGNFPKEEHQTDIFIKHSEITQTDEETDTSLSELIKTYYETVKSYCSEEENENMEVCLQMENTEIDSYRNQTDFVNTQISDLIRSFQLDKERRERQQNIYKNITSSMAQDLDGMENKQSDVSNSVTEIQDNLKSLTTNIVTVIIIIFGTVLILTLVFLIFYFKKENLVKKLSFMRGGSNDI